MTGAATTSTIFINLAETYRDGGTPEVGDSGMISFDVPYQVVSGGIGAAEAAITMSITNGTADYS